MNKFRLFGLLIGLLALIYGACKKQETASHSQHHPLTGCQEGYSRWVSSDGFSQGECEALPNVEIVNYVPKITITWDVVTVSSHCKESPYTDVYTGITKMMWDNCDRVRHMKKEFFSKHEAKEFLNGTYCRSIPELPVFGEDLKEMRLTHECMRFWYQNDYLNNFKVYIDGNIVFEGGTR